MEYPAAVLEKARRLEQLLQRVAAGEPLDEANEAFGFSLDQRQLVRWQARYEGTRLDGQILLANLHDWAAQAYFAPPWRTLSLEKATQMIYRKAGWVTWDEDRMEVVLEPYRYPGQQRDMEATCARFNAANLRWRDGRPLHISVAPSVKF
jgi:hypothetical protein